jgi:hypothetical protein
LFIYNTAHQKIQATTQKLQSIYDKHHVLLFRESKAIAFIMVKLLVLWKNMSTDDKVNWNCNAGPWKNASVYLG